MKEVNRMGSSLFLMEGVERHDNRKSGSCEAGACKES